MQAKQHDPRRGRMPVPKYQLAEIVVERQEDPILIESGLQDDGVRFPCQGLGRMHNIIALADQPRNDACGKILIRKIALAHADFEVGASR